MIGNGEGEDPALLTQSSKIVYIETKDLEPLEKPEKEFKKTFAFQDGTPYIDIFETYSGRLDCKGLLDYFYIQPRH